MNIKEDKYVHVINIESSEFNPNSFIFNANGVIPEKFVVIFNIIGDNSISFSNCDFSSLNGYADRILWNMPDVPKIWLNVDKFYGSILAPNAYVTVEKGSLQGQIIVKNFNGPLSIEWVPFESCIPNDLPEIDLDPVVEPESDIEPTNSDSELEPGEQCSSDNPLGVVSNFGAFTFGDFTSSGSDVQGRVGCKGKLSVTGYSINKEVYGSGKNNGFKCNEGPLKNDYQYAIVAGTLDIQNSGIYNGGIVYIDNDDKLADNIKKDVTDNGCKYIKSFSIIDFDDEERKMIELSKKLGELKDTESVNIKKFIIIIIVNDIT